MNDTKKARLEELQIKKNNAVLNEVEKAELEVLLQEQLTGNSVDETNEKSMMETGELVDGEVVNSDDESETVNENK